MLSHSFPILEFDPDPNAILDPCIVYKAADVPEHCVLCFFPEVIAKVCGNGNAQVVANLRTEIGDHPLYEIAFEGKRLGVFHPGVGAPLAAGFLDELVALGCKKFIACGGAGVLDREIAVGHVVVPASAVRDEGTSYHYLAPSREVGASPEAVAAIEAVLQARHCDYVVGKTWTTDGLYRETPEKIKRRRAEGCLTVEMEAAAFFAVAQFRGVSFAQLLYGGDDMTGSEWDSRNWNERTSVREKLFWLAAEACITL